MPVNWDALEVSDSSKEEFDAMPRPQRGRLPNPKVVDALDRVDSRGFVKLKVQDEAEFKPLRTALINAARRRGYRLEIAPDLSYTTIIVTKSIEQPRPRQARQAAPVGAPPRPRGRPRKQAAPVRDESEDAFAVDEVV